MLSTNYMMRISKGKEVQTIVPGNKLTQGVLVPVIYADIEVVDSESDLYSNVVTERGDGGFGSTGLK